MPSARCPRSRPADRRSPSTMNRFECAFPLFADVAIRWRSRAVPRMVSCAPPSNPSLASTPSFVTANDDSSPSSTKFVVTIARSAGAIGRDQNIYVTAGALVLGAWFGVSTAIAAAGGFNSAVTGNFAVPLLALTLGLPVVVGVAVGLTSSAIRELISQSNIQPGVIAVNALRIIPGAVFVVLGLFGVLPAIFAVPAGLGDVIVGSGALLAYRWVSSGRWGRALVWNVLGLVDFVNAAALGLATTPGPLHVLQTNPTSALFWMQPLAIVPIFMVPIYVLLHLVSVRYLVASRSKAPFSRALKLEATS